MNIDMPEPDAVTVGFTGQPGSRVFYLQARQGDIVHSLKLEKEQVAALGVAITELLADVVVEETPSAPELVEPGEPDWVVGSIGLTSFDESTGRVTMVLEQLAAEAEEEAATARLALTTEQLAALAQRCAQSLTGGRPPCPLCGRPMDPEGHVCPKSNGSTRH